MRRLRSAVIWVGAIFALLPVDQSVSAGMFDIDLFDNVWRRGCVGHAGFCGGELGIVSLTFPTSFASAADRVHGQTHPQVVQPMNLTTGSRGLWRALVRSVTRARLTAAA